MNARAPVPRWRRSRCLTLVLGLMVAASLASGCSSRREERPARHGERLKIAKISTELFAIDRDAKTIQLDFSLEALVRERVAASKGLEIVDPSQDRGARLRVAARLVPDGYTGELHALVMAKLTNTDSIPLTANIDATRAKLPDGQAFSTADYIDHMKKAVAETLEALDEQAVVLTSGNAGLIKALDDPETDVRMAAIRALGERRARDAVEPLCGLLAREKNEAGQAAVGSLVMIGDEKAVPCIIDWAGSNDRRLAIIIDPLAAIGGQEAREYLEMVASGHEVQGIKLSAEEGLRRLEANEKARAQQKAR